VQVQSVQKNDAYNGNTVELPRRHAVSGAIANEVLCVSTIEEFLALEHAWRKLESDNIITPTVFQSFEWAKAYCNSHLAENSANQLHIVTGYQGERLVFLFPMMVTSLHGLRTLQWLSEPLGQYGDIMCARGQDVSFWMSRAFEFVKSTTTIDLVRLRHIRGDSLAQPFVTENMVDAKYDERAPFLDLTAFKTESEYDARYTSTQRKRRKKIRKSLEDLGEVTFCTLQPGPKNDSAITESIIEKNAWLSDRGRYNRVMGCSRHVEFLKALTKAKSGSFEMITSELKAGPNPVSWEIGFRYRGTHFAYITSHVHKLTDLSPGRLHMDLSQRAALAAGQKRFDLMVPYDAHKESWSSGMVDANDYYYPNSNLGRLYGAIYLRTLRPFVRKIYYNLSPAVLRLLQTCYFCKRP
jgi:CelD/BcsL family acetyltransferase involved in cellulose biosynthesis